MNKEFWTEVVDYFEIIFEKPYSVQDKYNDVELYHKAWELSTIKGELDETIKDVMNSLSEIALSDDDDAYLKYKKILTECEKRNIYL